MPQTLEQVRAEFAWRCVTGVKPTTLDKYTKLAKGFPMMVMNSGLMQSLAFLNDKAEGHHLALLDHVSHWITSSGEGKQAMPFNVLMPQLMKADPVQFRHATAETLAILRWIRQFAPALNQ